MTGNKGKTRNDKFICDKSKKIVLSFINQLPFLSLAQRCSLSASKLPTKATSGKAGEARFASPVPDSQQLKEKELKPRPTPHVNEWAGGKFLRQKTMDINERATIYIMDTHKRFQLS